MTAGPLLAHGGTAGLALEIALIALPIVVFIVLAAWSGRRARAAEAAEAAEAAGATGDGASPHGRGADDPAPREVPPGEGGSTP